MADEPELAARVRAALDGVPGVEERRMFGSPGFLVQGTVRITVGAHDRRVAMVRTGAAQHEALQRDGAGPAIMHGRPMGGWVFLEHQAIESDEQISFWIRTGLAAV